MTEYRQCSFCVMDTTDPGIRFDGAGKCNRCSAAEDEGRLIWKPNSVGRSELDNIVQNARKSGRGNEYDCIIGVSGGIDSAYLAYRLRRDYPDLRILAIHVDGGWNSEVSTRNIEILVKKLKIDLHTEVVDWEEMRDLQAAFLRASVPNQDIPQDHAFFSTLYHVANRYKIRYFFSGGNFATESILPAEWGYPSVDLKHLRGVHKKFGKLKRLKKYPTISLFKWYFWYPHVKKFSVIRPLNFMEYNKDRSKDILRCELSWSDYGGKHHESRFTKFFQCYYLPKKFGWDKRKAHLSSLIVSGQMSRSDAVSHLNDLAYDLERLDGDLIFIAKKLAMSVDDLRRVIESQPIAHQSYPNSNFFFKIKKLLSRIRR